MGLTQEQWEAVRTRRVSVALSAGAGCGKTHVLTERFLSYLDPRQTDGRPVRLTELVAITFTERAAREMRVRIRRACRARLRQADDPQEASYWLGLVRELDSARISTIHSFCAQLLRRYAVEAGMDPHFRVLQQPEADILLLELLDDVLRRRLAQQEDVFLDLVSRFGLNSLREMVQELLACRWKIDFPYWTQRTPEELVRHWEKLYQEWYPRYLGDFPQQPLVQQVLRLREALESVPVKMRQRFLQVEESLKKLPEDVDRHAKLLRENARVQGVDKKQWPNEELHEQFQKTLETFRDKALKDLAKFSRWPPPSQMEVLARMSLHVLSLAYQVHQDYENAKRTQAALDFQDLIGEAVRLLEGPYAPDIRRQLAAEIRHLLVDEFQDTDPMQVRLIERLCGEDFLQGKLFFVGDYKQSIYRFRGARPEEFHRLRRQTPPPGQLSLTVNFRSQPGILDFVNALFCEELGPEYEPLHAHRAQSNPEPIVEFLWAKEPLPEESSDQSEEDSEQPSDAGAEQSRRREADWIARRIRQLLDSGEPLVWDRQSAQQGQDRLRPPQPGDIAILFRALSDVQFYEEALRRYEIPYYLVGGHAFYSQQEIYDLVNLLRAIQWPLDDVALVGVLRSPFFNLYDEILYWLAQHPKGLWAGLCAERLPAELEPAQRRRVRFAAHTLQTLRAAKDRLSVADLIQEALHRTGYDAALLAEFLGERKLANLHKLIDQARALDQSRLFSLADFILQLSEFVARQPKEALAATFPETCEVVRLMTIHQAKGLEFPIVVVADLDRGGQSARGGIAFDPQFGPIIPTPSDFDKNTANVWEIYWYEENREEQAESMRIFYVAATRAADYLILSTGWNKKTPQGPWMQLLARRVDLETGQWKVSLPDGYPAPRIRVVQSRPEFAGQVGSGRTRRYLEDLLTKTEAAVEQNRGRIPPFLGPLAPDPKAPRRYSFSRLSGRLHLRTLGEETSDHQEPQENSVPKPGQGREEALELGILIHAMLAQMDYRSAEGLKDLAGRLAFRHLGHLPEEARSRIQREAVEIVGRFLASERARQMAAAQKVYREVEFLLAWPPGRDTPSGDYVQGFLDCLYQDAAGRWYVVDFKTHQIQGRNVRQLAAEYELQMLLYGLALQEIFGVGAAELTIYFLRPGKEIVFTWTEASRQWVVEQMERAIRQAKESGR